MTIRSIFPSKLGLLGTFAVATVSGLGFLVVLALPLSAQDLDEELLRDLPATRPATQPATRPATQAVPPITPETRGKSNRTGSPGKAGLISPAGVEDGPNAPSGRMTPPAARSVGQSPPTSPDTATASDAASPTGRAKDPSTPPASGVLPSRPVADLPADLEGEDVGETPVATLHRAQGRMTEAARRLGAGDASAATRGLQSDALAALDTVITHEAERRRRGGAGRRSGAGGKSGRDGKGGQETAGGTPPGDRTGEDRSGGKPDAATGEPRSEGSGQGGQEGQEGAAGGTAGGTGDGEGKRAREPMESRAAVMDTEAWGQLPPQLRERLRNSLPERFLPGFESMLEAYYRRLAESPKDRAESRP